MDELAWLLPPIVGLLGAWSWSVSTRERVLAISAEACRTFNLQRLDDSVSLQWLRWVWRPTFALEVCYVFEFSTDGANRCRGQVVLRGKQLQHTRLELPDGPLLLDAGLS